MAELGIPLSSDLVIALLNTRPDVWPAEPMKCQIRCTGTRRYHAGDILWVRETHQFWGGDDPHLEYRADRAVAFEGELWCYEHLDMEMDEGQRWRSSTQMPKRAARLWLKVISVRREHIQAISPEVWVYEIERITDRPTRGEVKHDRI